MTHQRMEPVFYPEEAIESLNMCIFSKLTAVAKRRVWKRGGRQTRVQRKGLERCHFGVRVGALA